MRKCSSQLEPFRAADFNVLDNLEQRGDVLKKTSQKRKVG